MVAKKLNVGANFFDELKAWSEIKLRILTKYADAYHRYRGSKNRKIYYIDGFAGKGRYGEGDSDYKDGSPVLLASLAQDIAQSDKPYRIHCINVEMNPEYYAELTDCLKPFDPTLVEARLGTFAQHLQDILNTIAGWPAVFFLDPFGVKAIKLSELTPLLHRRDTELLLNLNTRQLRRLAGFEDSSDAKDRDAKLRLVSEVLGEDPNNADPVWLREWQRLDDPLAWESWAAQTYMKLLTRNSPFLNFSLSYPVRQSYHSNPKYYLVFATRAWEAVEAMNDLVCTEEDNLFERSEAITTAGQFTLFPALRKTEHSDALDALLDEMHAYGLAHQGCCRQELIHHFILERFGQFKKKHYRQALKRLADDGKARFMKRNEKDLDPVVFL